VLLFGYITNSRNKNTINIFEEQIQIIYSNVIHLHLITNCTSFCLLPHGHSLYSLFLNTVLDPEEKALTNHCDDLRCCWLILLQQFQAELQAGLEVAQEASRQAESEREKIRNQQRFLDEEQRRLKDFERDLTSRARELETLTQLAVATKEEGRRALEEARRIEKQRSEQTVDIQRQLVELRDREKRLAQV